MKKIVLISLAASTALMAAGYKVPESSLDAVALSAANVAYADGADAAYYNPANMVWNDDANMMEAGLIYIGLSKVKYKGTATLTGPVQNDIDSKAENFVVPHFHYVAPKLGNFRVGLSIVPPAGLSKRWDDQPGRFYSQEYTLETVDINPSLAIAVDEKLAVALGVRLVHSSGVVKGNGSGLSTGLAYDSMNRDMTGDTFEFGYNLALSYRPTDSLSLATTYRSKVDLNVEGDGKVSNNAGFVLVNGVPTAVPAVNYDGKVNVALPLPATLSLAAAYTFQSDTTVEFVYERTFWSSYKELDFDYPDDPFAEAVFGGTINKNWNDTSSYRLGITQEYDKWTAMFGALYDYTPIPDETLNFETPDSDSYSFSLGGRYAVDETWSVGLAGLMSIRDDRTLDASSANESGLVGTFSNSKVYLLSAGVEYKF